MSNMARLSECEGKVTARETIIGIIGELMLFLTSAFLMAATAAMLLASEEYPKEYIAIGTPLVALAGVTYTARGYVEKRRWKRLIMTTWIAVTAVALLTMAITDLLGITVWATVRGFLCVSVAATMLLILPYLARTGYLWLMYNRKRQIVKNVKSGEYAAAVKVAEGEEPCVGGVEGTDYVKNPEKLSESVALALSCALARVGRGKDAERVSEVSRVRNLS